MNRFIYVAVGIVAVVSGAYLYFGEVVLAKHEDSGKVAWLPESFNAESGNSSFVTLSGNLPVVQPHDNSEPCILAETLSPFIAAPDKASNVSAKRICKDESGTPFLAASPENSSSLSAMLQAELANNKSSQGSVRWSFQGMGDEESKSADGILVNVDRPVKGLVELVKASLESGQIVVLDTSGGEENRLKIQELTLKLGSMGVQADSVMLYKSDSSPGAEVSVQPYDLSNKKELASLMSVVGRRPPHPAGTH